ncbi:hypothetical protein [Photobacterium damselae]|uniref:hypothetical protein n=1 Tax=Photobacterium damselae TaxID=38293 RepID=UPI001F312479|nr:hypothetical protein [Photobacterium damselae]UKA12944.1 hypothetical protein IHC91_21400 [Photobacterium damselae subsp. damselae]
MAYSEDEILTALENADKAGDTKAAQQLASLYQEMKQKPADQQPAAQQKQPEPQDLPEIGDAPEIGGAGKGFREMLNKGMNARAIKASAGLLFSGDDKEKADIMKKQFGDDVKLFDDGRGNVIARLPSGDYYLNKEGLSGQDVAKFVAETGASMALGPGGLMKAGGSLAANLGRTAAADAAVELARQKASEQLGGNKVDLLEAAKTGAASAATGGLIHGAGRAVRRLKGGKTVGEAKQLQKSVGNAEEATADTLTNEIKKGDVSSLANKVDVDQGKLEAAERLGIGEDVLPSHVSNNSQYKDLEQSLASIEGSGIAAKQTASHEKLTNKADELISKFDGTADASEMNAAIKEEATATIGKLKQDSDKLYSQLEENLDIRQPAPANATLEYLQQKSDDLGGMMQGHEKRLIKELTEGEPTYARLDAIRKEIGSGFAKEGIFASSTKKDLGELYNRLLDDQRAAISNTSPDLVPVFDQARSLVNTRKGLEDSAKSLMGKDLENAAMAKVKTAMSALSKGNIGTFKKTLNDVPENVRKQAVVSSFADVFKKKGADGNLDLSGVTKWHQNMTQNKLAKRELTKLLGKDAMQQIDDVNTMAQSLASTKQFLKLNGRTASARERFESKGVNRILKVLGTAINIKANAATGGLASIGGDIGGKFADKAIERATGLGKIDKIITSKDFMQAIKDRANGNIGAEKIRLKRLEATKEYKQWHKGLEPTYKERVLQVGILNFLDDLGSDQGDSSENS